MLENCKLERKNIDRNRYEDCKFEFLKIPRLLAKIGAVIINEEGAQLEAKNQI